MLRSIGRWLFWIAGCVGLVYMLWNLIFSDHGYLVYQQEAAQVQQLQAEVADLKIERERLAKEVLRFRNDPKAMEELIHRELGYVYPDEYMVIMPGESAVKGQVK
ncbi:MAG: septum formation initiator family protein [Mariprofundus sp.]|nr:septum formation initiator family protein [Mariprofundus sp.]